MKDALFYHIPRTGGLMLATKVWNYIGRDVAYVDKGQRQDGFASDDRPDAPGHWKEYDGPFVSSHEPARLLTRHEEGRVRFTILRDPYERTLSLLNLRQNQMRAVGMNPVDYMLADSLAESIRIGFRDRAVRQLGGNYWEDDMPIAEQFDAACQLLTELDWVGYTNQLDDTLPDFFEGTLEVPWDGPERINGPRTYIEDLSPHAQDTIRKLNVWDQKLYLYAQELTASR
jgi:hypothetical protein